MSCIFVIGNIGTTIVGNGDFDVPHMNTDNIGITIVGNGDFDVPHMNTDNIGITTVGNGDFDVPHINYRQYRNNNRGLTGGRI